MLFHVLRGFTLNLSEHSGDHTQLIGPLTQLGDELINGDVQKTDFVQLVHALWKRLSLNG